MTFRQKTFTLIFRNFLHKINIETYQTTFGILKKNGVKKRTSTLDFSPYIKNLVIQCIVNIALTPEKYHQYLHYRTKW